MKIDDSSHLAPREATASKRGSVLMSVLFVMIPLAALTYGLMVIGVSFSSENTHAVEDEQALFLAEAGIDEALIALRSQTGTGQVGTEADPVYYGRGLYWVEREDIGNLLFILRSHGMYEAGRAALETLVFEYYDSGQGTTIFSRRPLRVESTAFVDSFDSNLGDYDSQLIGDFVNDGAIIESNAGIRLDPDVELYGNSHSGPGFKTNPHSTVEVSGSLQPLPAPKVLDPVVEPVILPSLGAVTVSADVTLPPGDYDFTDVEVKTGNVLTITGPARVVLDDWRLRSNAEVVFDSSAGPIEVWISGKFEQASNSTITTTSSSAADLTLNFSGGAGQDVELHSNSDFYGVIYAPDATVEIFSNFEIYGAVVADQIILNANTRVHYDEALLNNIADPPTFIVATWSVTEFQNRALMINRTDPFRLLGVEPALLNLPADGHEQKVP